MFKQSTTLCTLFGCEAWHQTSGQGPARSYAEGGLLLYTAQAAGVQVYFAGHDHDLEHIHPAEGALPHYIISGGGSKCDRPFIDRRDSLFQWLSSGAHSPRAFCVLCACMGCMHV
jgi:hypothetical protein